MIRNLYGYKTYSHAVFAGFLPGFISVHGCFCFAARDKIFSPKHFQSLSFTMARQEHTYALLDSTVVSLSLLCGPDFDYDFPDAVPFHVTEMENSPTGTGEYNFNGASFIWVRPFLECSKPSTRRVLTFASSIRSILTSWRITWMKKQKRNS